MTKQGYSQADLSDPAVHAACGLKLKGNTLVSDDADEMVIVELNEERMKDIAERQAAQ